MRGRFSAHLGCAVGGCPELLDIEDPEDRVRYAIRAGWGRQSDGTWFCKRHKAGGRRAGTFCVLLTCLIDGCHESLDLPYPFTAPAEAMEVAKDAGWRCADGLWTCHRHRGP